MVCVAESHARDTQRMGLTNISWLVLSILVLPKNWAPAFLPGAFLILLAIGPVNRIYRIYLIYRIHHQMNLMQLERLP